MRHIGRENARVPRLQSGNERDKMNKRMEKRFCMEGTNVMKIDLKRVLALVLCMLMMVSASALAQETATEDEPQRIVAKPGASYKVNGTSVTITISGEPGLRMYVDATIDWDDNVYAGDKVTFSGLEAGKTYGIEVDYYDLQPGVSAYRTSFTVPTAQENTPTPKPTEKPTASPTTKPTATPTPKPTEPLIELITPKPPTSGGSSSAGKQPTVRKIGAAVTTGDGIISVKVTDADPWQVYVAVDDLMKLIYPGETAKFEGLAAGKHEIEVDYVEAVPGVSPFRTTVTLEQKKTLQITEVTAGKGMLTVKGTARPGEDIALTTTPAAQKTVTVRADAKGQFTAEIALSAGTYTQVKAVCVSDNTVYAVKKGTFKVTKETTYKTLQYGDTGDDVEEMTERLRDLGYMEDDVRRYSSAVRNAVKTFQKINGLYADGVAGQATLALLYSDKAIAYGASGTYLTLQRGDKGLDSIYNLQRRLKELGYYTIAVDGVYGSGTERAVRHFQRINGLEKTGIADHETQKLLYSSSAKKASSASAEEYKTLSRSSTYHPAVVPLQRRLKELGYAVGSADGYFGSNTYRAVREFQRRNGLKTTGVADEATQRVLFSSSAIAASGASSSSSSSSSIEYRLLYWGCAGEDVKILQKTLLAKGYTQVRVADGVFGQWTYDAVRAFQKDHGLAVDGIAGKNTQKVLYGY